MEEGGNWFLALFLSLKQHNCLLTVTCYRSKQGSDSFLGVAVNTEPANAGWLTKSSEDDESILASDVFSVFQ